MTEDEKIVLDAARALGFDVVAAAKKYQDSLTHLQMASERNSRAQSEASNARYAVEAAKDLVAQDGAALTYIMDMSKKRSERGEK